MICPNCGIEIETNKRNLKQNNLFHLWMQVLGDELGYTSVEDVKRDVKRQILGTREVVNRLTGEITFEDFQTSTMTKKQMADFMNKVKIWSLQEFQVLLPYWEEEGYSEMVEFYSK